MCEEDVTIISTKENWFVKDKAWFRWSRALVRMDEVNPWAIDISVQPLNYDSGGQGLSELLEMRIRKHLTFEESTRFVIKLDSSLSKSIRALVGDYFYNLLVHEDLLSEIDLEKLDHCKDNFPWGGGIPFIMVCKDRDKYLPVLEHWFKVMDKSPHYLTVQDVDMLGRYKLYQEKRNE